MSLFLPDLKLKSCFRALEFPQDSTKLCTCFPYSDLELISQSGSDKTLGKRKKIWNQMGNANFCWHFDVGKIKKYKAVFRLPNPQACQRHSHIHRCQKRMVYILVGYLTITIAHIESDDSVRHISLYGLRKKIQLRPISY